MRELPFSLRPEQRKAVVAGLQTQYRTPKGLNEVNKEPDNYKRTFFNKVTGLCEFLYLPDDTCLEIKAPYQVDDRRYLQEPIFIHSGGRHWGKEIGTQFGYLENPEESLRTVHVCYAYARSYRSASRMPKYAARHWFEVTEVRAEQVQDITGPDVWAEGVEENSNNATFATLWDSIYGKGAWERNDWVWVTVFRKVKE